MEEGLSCTVFVCDVIGGVFCIYEDARVSG